MSRTFYPRNMAPRLAWRFLPALLVLLAETGASLAPGAGAFVASADDASGTATSGIADAPAPALSGVDAIVALDAVLAAMERRYAAAETAVGNFQQIYRAPGMIQKESGVFRLKRPGLMHWEYRVPEEKLFVADGKNCFLYVPLDRQVTVHPLTPADIARTPLAFLLGQGSVSRDYRVAPETEFPAAFTASTLLRLTPVRDAEEFVFVTLELDALTAEIRRVIIRERSGNTSEFLLSDVVLNRKLDKKEFQFKVPKGVDVVRLEQ